MLEKALYKLWKGIRLSNKYIKLWGCLTNLVIFYPKNVNLWSKTVDCVFIGYVYNSSACKFLVHKSYKNFCSSIDISVPLSRNRGKRINQLKYSLKNRSLMYVMNCTWCNIAYSISKMSRFTSNTSINHLNKIKRVLKYLRYILNYGIYYTGYSVILEGYSDVNWIFDPKDSKSTSQCLHTWWSNCVVEIPQTNVYR